MNLWVTDEQWFAAYPDRKAHIRLPREFELQKNKQRAMFYVPECEQEFRSLGDHDKNRRRIIIWRVPPENKYYDKDKPQLLKVPFLAFADETIADTDAVLLPIIAEIMSGAAEEYGMVSNVVE